MGYDIKKIWERIEKGQIRKLEPNDLFPFKCKRCNRCCYGRDILLSGFDIIRIAHRLKLTSSQFIGKYGICYIGEYSKLPLVILKFENKKCPFLRSYGCQIHSVKPSVCRRYPLGKVIEFGKNGEKRTIYFMQQLEKECRGFDPESKTTVEEFLKESGIEVYDQAGETWNDILVECGKIVSVIEKWENKQEVYTILAQILYDSDAFKQKAGTPLETLRLIKERIKGLEEIIEQKKKELRGEKE